MDIHNCAIQNWQAMYVDTHIALVGESPNPKNAIAAGGGESKKLAF